MEFSQEEFEEILSIFSEESDEIVHRLNNNILTLEKNPNNKDIITELFRDAHSLKGAARMIGFNDIQAIAHKIEDILGLAKDDKIFVNSEVTDVIYKSIDFVNMSIQLSVKAKKEVKLSDFGKFVSALDDISNSANNISSTLFKTPEKTSAKSSQIDNSEEFVKILTTEIDDINARIIEIFYLLNKIHEEADLNLVLALIYDVDSLSLTFTKCSDTELKKNISDILLKLEFVSKNTGILNKIEIDDLKNKFKLIINNIINILNKYNLTVLDYETLAMQKLQPKVAITNEITISKPIFKSEALIENILKLENSNEIAEVILQDLSELKHTFVNTQAEEIFQKVYDILTVIKTQNIRPNNEVLNILKQSVRLVDKLVNDSQIADKEDADLLLQSLDITGQMITLNKDEALFEVPAIKPNISQETPQNILKIRNQDVFQIFESTAIKTLRVDTQKLDKLVNQIGEVIISKIKTQKHILELEEINNRLVDLYEFEAKSQNYLKYYDRKISQIEQNADINVFINFNKQFLVYWADAQNRLHDEMKEIYNLHKRMLEDDAKLSHVVNKLEQMVKDIRLLPLATVFHMIPRMVRDISKEKDKDIELSISGSETNADKKIVEEIKTPLIHIIRNAIDHGIETPNERLALGKEPSGKIQLSARHSENKIIIEVSDDGRGVNLEKIRQKAITKGLLTFEEINSMSDEQIMNLIFWPGFSTEEKVTDISGRGIGLDIVQTKITQLNGKVKVQSIIGKGTRVIIELPVTMATMRSFVIKLNSQVFAIPVTAIKSVIKISNDDIYTKDGKENILYQDMSVPIFNLSHVLGFKPTEEIKNKHTVLLIEAENDIVGFIVEELVGDQEILTKELAPPLFKLKNISGITTLINGEICLIINVAEILKTIMSNDFKQVSTSKLLQITQNEEVIPAEMEVLVVDDFMTTRIMLKNILSAKGYNVDVANDAIEALEMLSHKKYNIIISDIEMATMNGYSFAEKIKSQTTNAPPIILISSLPQNEGKFKSQNAGADLFISKNDFNQEYFLRSIEYLIKKRLNQNE